MPLRLLFLNLTRLLSATLTTWWLWILWLVICSWWSINPRRLSSSFKLLTESQSDFWKEMCPNKRTLKSSEKVTWLTKLKSTMLSLQFYRMQAMAKMSWALLFRVNAAACQLLSWATMCSQSAWWKILLKNSQTKLNSTASTTSH